MVRTTLHQNDNLLRQRKQYEWSPSKFSKYSIKEVCEIMKSDDNEEENVLLLHSETIMDGISEVTGNELSYMDSNIIFYVAGFIVRSLKKQVKYEECSNILGRNEEIVIPTTDVTRDDCCYFLDSINRGFFSKTK